MKITEKRIRQIVKKVLLKEKTKAKGRDAKTAKGKSILDYIDPADKEAGYPFRAWVNVEYTELANAKRKQDVELKPSMLSKIGSSVKRFFTGEKAKKNKIVKGLDLDKKGSPNNSYIRRAWAMLGDEYLDDVGEKEAPSKQEEETVEEARRIVRKILLSKMR